MAAIGSPESGGEVSGIPAGAPPNVHFWAGPIGIRQLPESASGFRKFRTFEVSGFLKFRTVRGPKFRRFGTLGASKAGRDFRPVLSWARLGLSDFLRPGSEFLGTWAAQPPRSSLRAAALAMRQLPKAEYGFRKFRTFEVSGFPKARNF